jgi:3-deoxy-manno-octulosonate cytidylyltransferase (CMP-KDO synthetase)
MGFKVVIPARYESTRLPGKPLIEIGEIPMIIHVAKRANMSGAEEVLIATDDERVQKVSESFGFEAIMTQKRHISGTDRILEVANKKKWLDDQVIINVQGDEPLIDPKLISMIATAMDEEGLDYVTACSKFQSKEEFVSPDNVKVVFDKDNFAIYFSRALIPFNTSDGDWNRDASYHHIGIYGYSLKLLQIFCSLPTNDLEKTEKLEQLRALKNRIPLKVLIYQGSFIKGVDTFEDLVAVKKIICN